MENDIITQDTIYANIGRHLVGDLQDGWPPGVYRATSQNDVWHAYVNSIEDRVGGSWVVVISKKTGEILTNMMVGE